MRSSQLQTQLRDAIQLAQSGQRSEARHLLEGVVQQNPNDALAWMWLATLSTDRAERIACLERTLILDPDNARAQDAYTQITGRAFEAPPGATMARAVQRISPSTVNVFVLVALVLVIGVVALVLLGVFDSGSTTTALPTVPSRTPSNTPGPSPTATWTPLPSDTPGPSPTSVWDAPPATWTPSALSTSAPEHRPAATESPAPGAETE